MTRTYEFSRNGGHIFIEVNPELIICSGYFGFNSKASFFASVPLSNLRYSGKQMALNLLIGTASVTLSMSEFVLVSNAVTALTGKPITHADEVLA